MSLSNKVFGYVYNNKGFYDKKYILKDTPENIANFIVQNMHHKCVITDTVDQLILSTTQGGFIDYCKDQKYLSEVLMGALYPLQMGEKELSELEFDENDYYYEQVM